MSGVDSAQDEVRQIVNDARPALFARGWHCLGPVDNYDKKSPHRIKAFGQELLIQADFDAPTQIINARCPLVTPEDNRTTATAREPVCQVHDAPSELSRIEEPCWPALEQDGLLYVWNDPEGNPPIARQSIPRIEEAASAQWTDWVWNELVVKVAPRDVVDHLADTARFFYANTDRPTFFKNVFEDHVATQYFDGPMHADYTRRHAQDKPEPPIWTNSVASYFGPAFMIDELNYVYENYDLNAVLINAHYPIDDQHLALLSAVIVKKHEALTGDPQEFAADQATRISHGFSMDAAIWQQKTRIDNPLLCEEDGPVYQLRRWYAQFFSKVAKIQPAMTDRFEYEMDTTLTMENWQRSLARMFSTSRKPTGKKLA